MSRMHGVMKSMNVLNCLLSLAVAAGVTTVVVPFLNLEIRATLPIIRPTEPEQTFRPASPPPPSFADYLTVSEKNLFHPERRLPPEKSASAEKPVIPKPDLVLYGTLITDNLSIAYIEDRKAPYSTPGRGKRQTQLKKGDSVGGYVLREIEPNRIVLTMGEETLVVMLDEKDKQRGGETTASPSAPAGTPAAGRPQAAVLPSAPRTVIPRTEMPPPAAAPPSPARPGEFGVPSSPRPSPRRFR